jgi:hypothetical protein
MAVEYKVPDKPQPPPTKYVIVRDPAEIAAIRRDPHILTDPHGDYDEKLGEWVATRDSLNQHRGKPYKVHA